MSTNARSTARSDEIFRCCNVSNVCTYSAYSVVALVFRFGIIPLLFIFTLFYPVDDLWSCWDIVVTDFSK